MTRKVKVLLKWLGWLCRAFGKRNRRKHKHMMTTSYDLAPHPPPFISLFSSPGRPEDVIYRWEGGSGQQGAVALLYRREVLPELIAFIQVIPCRQSNH